MLKCVTCTFDQHFFFYSSLMRTITEPSTFWPFKRVPFNHQGPIWSCFVRLILSQPLFFFKFIQNYIRDKHCKCIFTKIASFYTQFYWIWFRNLSAILCWAPQKHIVECWLLMDFKMQLQLCNVYCTVYTQTISTWLIRCLYLMRFNRFYM